VPDSGEIVGLDVLVLEVEGVLPDINADEGDVRKKRILVGGSRDFQNTVLGIESEPTPAAALDAESLGVEILYQGLQRSKVAHDGVLKRAIL